MYVVHRHCLKRWLLKNAICPICRKDVQHLPLLENSVRGGSLQNLILLANLRAAESNSDEVEQNNETETVENQLTESDRPIPPATE